MGKINELRKPMGVASEYAGSSAGDPAGLDKLHEK